MVVPSLRETEIIRLREVARRRLIETGWRDSVKSRCIRELECATRESKDITSVTSQFIFTTMQPYAIEAVPYAVKSELHEMLREIFSMQSEPDKIRIHS